MRSRVSMVVLTAALSLLVGSAVAVAAVAGVKVKAAKYPSLGSNILVDGAGRPLYHLTNEKPKSIRCSGGCAKTWPPIILAKGTKPTVGPGIRGAKLGTIRRPDGRIQVTYAGLALYRYAGDTAGTARGQGLGKIWYVINPAGRIVTRAATAAPAGGDPGGTVPGGGGGDPGGGSEY